MPSSTSSSESGSPDVLVERPIPAVRLGLAAIVALLVFGVALAAWEAYWRDYGAVPGYRNSDGSWAIQRDRINDGEGNKTVLLGSSRSLSNINLDVWQSLSGERPIQLAVEGTSPVIPLEGLAADPDFVGRVIVGVSPRLFFSGASYRADVFKYHRNETPSQRASQRLSAALAEPFLAYYDPDYALFTLLKRQPWPQRAGVTVRRDVRKLFVGAQDRNTRMWQKLERDPAYQQIAKDIWAQNFAPPRPGGDAEAAKVRQKEIDRVTAAVARLKARGVDVLFVHHPVGGALKEFENRVQSRAAGWDVLLQRTGARGIHFEDHPQLQGLTLPEWSHLASADAKRYTAALHEIDQRDRAERGRRASP